MNHIAFILSVSFLVLISSWIATAIPNTKKSRMNEESWYQIEACLTPKICVTNTLKMTQYELISWIKECLASMEEYPPTLLCKHSRVPGFETEKGLADWLEKEASRTSKHIKKASI